MDPQSQNVPDLHMAPLDVGQDGLITDPSQGAGSMPQPNFSDATDTMLVSPGNGVSHSAAAVPGQMPISQSDAGAAVSTDDDDSLDEEWIQKAKVIVDQTKADPYQQSREISKVKASYLKTHYNKDIKVADDQSL